MASSLLLTVVVALTVVSVSVSPAQAQAQTCASKLIPCAEYLNATTKPPSSCCDPIREAVTNDLQCLCNLYKNPSFLSGIGVDVAQALRLPQLCGISSDVSACNNAESPSGSTTKPPPGSTLGSGNGVGKIASSGVVGLLMLSACMMLF